jgi:hypothetical protein
VGVAEPLPVTVAVRVYDELADTLLIAVDEVYSPVSVNPVVADVLAA